MFNIDITPYRTYIDCINHYQYKGRHMRQRFRPALGILQYDRHRAIAGKPCWKAYYKGHSLKWHSTKKSAEESITRARLADRAQFNSMKAVKTTSVTYDTDNLKTETPMTQPHNNHGLNTQD